jgi:SRSO17 transposase
MGRQPEQVPRAGPTPLWAVDVYLHPFAPLFRGSRQQPTWASLERYVTGLLTDLPRKNCDTIAAAVAGTTTERLQHLLTDADWDPLALDEARVRWLVARSPGDGILALDDTGLPKQGKASVGVARQYSGTLGKVSNCQVVVSAAYIEDAPATSTPLHWPVSARLSRHETWMRDTQEATARRQRARIPSDTTFQTKPTIALALVDRALAWGVPFKHVVADAGYGEIPTFLAGLEARRLPYVVGVPRDFGVRLPDEVQAVATAPPPPYAGKGRPRQPRPAPLWQAETLLECLPDEAWETVTWRQGTKAPLTTQFVAVRGHRATGSPDTGRSATHHRTITGPEGWLLGERPVPGETGERKWYFCWLPELPVDTPLRRLVTLAHARWPIEQCYEDAKGECGLDDYQGRRWEGLHRHLALVMLTYSFLVTQRLRSRAFPATPLPATAGVPPLSAHATRAAAAPPADLPSHASPGAPLAVRGPAALDRRH